MSIVANNDKLTCILTNYGLGRIAEALKDKEVNLSITKIKIGDGNGEYYVPQEVQTELRGPIQDGEFFITDKELLEDKLTVSFHTVISESFNNFDIREVGLYETVDGIDYLFAVSTQQPMVKPNIDLNYFITIDYYMFLKSANLSDVYDQIVLNPEDQLVTVQDLEDLMSTILFTEGNLMAQINENSHVIGLNRATQLYERMKKEEESYGYSSTYSNYDALLNYVSQDDIFGYWVFNYPRKSTATNSIIDINKNRYNFSSNLSVNLYKRVYQGLMPSLNFEKPNYFFLEEGPLMNFVDERANKDISSTMLFALNPLTKGVKRTLLARSNYATGAHVFEVNELPTNALEIKIFADKDNYLTFTTSTGSIPDKAHILAIIYESVEHNFKVLINGKNVPVIKTETGTYAHMNTTPTTLYCFSCTPKETIYADKNSSPVNHLYNKDGSTYAGSFWEIQNGVVRYKTNLTKYSEKDNVQTAQLYAYNYNDGITDHVIYTKDQVITGETKLLNSDYSNYVGTNFKVVFGENEYIIQYDIYATEKDPTKDIMPKTLYSWVYEFPIEKVWSNNAINPTILLTPEGDIYRGNEWIISNGQLIFRSRFTGERDEQFDVQTVPLNVASFITDKDGNRAQFIDSEIGIISVIMKELTQHQARDLSLNMVSLLGYNPCTILS